MTIKLQPSHGLVQPQLTQIRQLAKRCERFEKLQMKLNWSQLNNRSLDEINDFLCYAGEELVGYLALYAFGNREVEISAMVDPGYRQQGVFRTLLSAGRQEVKKRGIPDLLFICEQKSTSGKAAMQAIEADYQFTEYKMVLTRTPAAIMAAVGGLDLRPATADEFPLLARMDEICFQKPADNTSSVLLQEIDNRRLRQARFITLAKEIVGKVHLVDTGFEIYIGGFCILPEHRGQGFGTAVLLRVVDELLSAGHQRICLEVETKNKGALKIYERCGFEIDTAYDYYRMAAANPQPWG